MDGKMKRSFRAYVALAGLALALGATGQAQQTPPTTTVHDAAALKPPPGYKVAIVEFQDLECPDCARAFPVLKDAVAKYKVAWVQHDFPLPMHNWSFDAAVIARFFDSKSKDLGNDFRGAVFASQMYLHSPDDVRAFAQRFATQHGVQMPFLVDPQGKFAAEVKADYALGQKIGIEHTPTIWVVTDQSKGAPPFVEIVDRSKLYQILDAAIAQAGGVRDAAPKTAVKKAATAAK
jgi:protein-disulfide isomerase